MQDQSSHEQDDATLKNLDRFREQTILTLLLTEGQCVWSVDELASEVGERIGAIDALDRLKASGRCGEFVVATRAAIRFDGIHNG